MVVDSRLVLNKWALNRFPLLQLFHTATISFPLASVEQVEIGYSSYLSIAGFNSYVRIHTKTGKNRPAIGILGQSANNVRHCIIQKKSVSAR